MPQVKALCHVLGASALGTHPCALATLYLAYALAQILALVNLTLALTLGIPETTSLALLEGLAPDGSGGYRVL